MSRFRAALLALIGLFLWVTACSSYTQIEPGEVADHDKVRVTKTDGERDLLYDPELVTDTIRGHEQRESEREYYDRVLVIPLDQVSVVESVHGDALATTGVFGLAAAGAVVLVLGLFLISY